MMLWEVTKKRNYKKGQLRRSATKFIREENRKDRKKDRDKDNNWNAVPGLIHNIGTKFGRRATWIGASGDQTFVKIDESLINSHSLSKSSVVCSKTCIGIIPNQLEQASSFKSLVISKVDGSCRSFCPSSQRITLFNIIITELQNFNCPSSKVSVNSGANNKDFNPSLPRILNPEHMLPFKPGVPISRAHAALNIMSSLDTLTSAQEQNLQVLSDDRKRQNLSKVYSKEDFSVVNRFDSHGGGWGYSGHSIEAIRFMADTDILLGGFGLFGGRGEYTAKLKVFDIGPEGGDQEIDGDVLVETDEIPYECGARHKYPMLFDEPIQLTANRWYVAWARISGPSSDCGSSGQSVVTTEDQIIFYFKSSKKSNNGTDVNAGQIPQLLYRTITPDSQGLSKPCSEIEPVTVLTKDFSRTVTPEVGLLPVGPRKVFYFPSTTHWKPMEAFPYPPPGDAPSRGYRLPRGISQNVGWSSSRLCLKPLALSHLYEHHPPSYSPRHKYMACYADDIAIWHSHNDITESEKALNTTLKELSNQKVDLPTYLGVTLDPELRFSKHIEQTTNKALGKLNILESYAELLGAQDLKP
ncbi:e3 ubiquitin-protein ligase MYCBP2 [Trichonephila clavipes]|nr:e3 ubiquitin-protein ligase MYCBP2 [Trichonephila clavipes]